MKEKIIKNWYEIGYIKKDNFWREWIWSWNAFYSHEPKMEKNIKKYVDTDSIKSFIRITLLIKNI